MQAQSNRDRLSRARNIFLHHGGMLRARDALRYGIHPETLYGMRNSGALTRLGRGLYRLSDLPPLGNPDLVTVAMKVPNGVICLISALAFHELTTQIPHEVYVALQRGAEHPGWTGHPSERSGLRRQFSSSASRRKSWMAHQFGSTRPKRPSLTALSTGIKSAWIPPARRSNYILKEGRKTSTAFWKPPQCAVCHG